MENTYHKKISAKRGLLELNLKEVWQYRDLIALFTRKNFVLIYKQTILGPAWIILNPLISSIIYAVVFGGIAGIATEGIPTLLFYLCSNALWIFFSSCVSNNATAFTANANVFGKVYFPRLTVPVSNVMSAIIHFGVQMLLVLGVLGYYMIQGVVHPNWLVWLLVPVVLLQLGVLGLGTGIIVSSLTTKYRDLAILVTFGVQLWMYATPIVYPLSQLGDGLLRTIIMINPVTMPVELFRYAVLGSGAVEPLFWLLSWVVTILIALVGVLLFNNIEKTFMDTV